MRVSSYFIPTIVRPPPPPTCGSYKDRPREGHRISDQRERQVVASRPYLCETQKTSRYAFPPLDASSPSCYLMLGTPPDDFQRHQGQSLWSSSLGASGQSPSYLAGTHKRLGYKKIHKRSNHKEYFRAVKINLTNLVRQARAYRQLSQSHRLYPRCSKVERRITG